MSFSVSNLEMVSPLILRVVRFLLVAFSIIAIAFVCARFFWLILAGIHGGVAMPSLSPAQLGRNNISAIDVSMLSRVTPFKTVQGEENIDLILEDHPDAPETELDITLNGVRADGQGSGVAFISTGKDIQKRYFVGDAVSGLQDVTVKSIYLDGVLLSRAGRVERLSNFHDENIGIKSLAVENKSVVRSTPDRAEILKTNSDEQTETSLPIVVDTQFIDASMARSDIENLMNWARFEPVVFDGVNGVSVSPLNSQIFSQSGLQARDIVKAIDDFSLDETTDYEALLDSLGKSSQVVIHIIRNGQPVRLTINVLD